MPDELTNALKNMKTLEEEEKVQFRKLGDTLLKLKPIELSGQLGMRVGEADNKESITIPLASPQNKGKRVKDYHLLSLWEEATDDIESGPMMKLADMILDIESRIFAGEPRPEAMRTEGKIPGFSEHSPSMLGRLLHKDFSPDIEFQLPSYRMGVGLTGDLETVNLGRVSKLASDPLNATFVGGAGLKGGRALARAAEQAWTKGFVYGEAVAARVLSKTGIGKALKEGLGTTSVRFGDTFAYLQQRIGTQRILAHHRVKQLGGAIETMSDAQRLAAVRFMNPRVAGEKAVIPQLRRMKKKTFTPSELKQAAEAELTNDQMRVLVAFKREIRDKLGPWVEARGASPELLDEFAEGYLVRAFEDPKFTKRTTGPMPKGMRMSDIRYRKNAPGVVVKLEGARGVKPIDEVSDLLAGVGEATPSKGGRATSAKTAHPSEWWDTLSNGERKYAGGSQKKWGDLSKDQREAVKEIWDDLDPFDVPGIGRVEIMKAHAFSGNKGDVLVKFPMNAEKGVTEKAAMRLRNEFEKRYKQAYGKKANVKERFKALSEDDLQALGEITDPRETIYRTLSKMDEDIAKGDFFKHIADNPEMATTDIAKLQDGWTQLPDDYRLGPQLRKKIVRPDVARELKGFYTELPVWRKFYNSAMSEWKAWLTIARPATHARNFLGNFAFSGLADNFILNPANAKHYASAVKSMIAKDDVWREMIDSGVLGTQFGDKELRMLEPIFSKPHGPKEMAKAIAKQLSITKSVHGKVAAKLYNAEDAIFRAATFVKQRAAGQSVKESAQFVNRWFPNYGHVGPAIKWARNSPVGGPFASFTAEALRIHYNAVKYRPIKAAMIYGAMPAAAYGLSRATTGMTEAESALMRSQSRIPLPVRDDETGDVLSLDLGYILPLGTMTRAVGDKISRAAGGPGVDYSSEQRRWLDLMGPFLLQNPVVTWPIGFFSGTDPYWGRKYRRPSETMGEARTRFTQEQVAGGPLVAWHWLPSQLKQQIFEGAPYEPVGRDAQAVFRAARGQSYYSGEPMRMDRTLLKTLGGLDVRPLGAKSSQERNTGRFKAIMAARSKNVRKISKEYQRGATTGNKEQREPEARRKIARENYIRQKEAEPYLRLALLSSIIEEEKKEGTPEYNDYERIVFMRSRLADIQSGESETKRKAQWLQARILLAEEAGDHKEVKRVGDELKKLFGEIEK